MKRVLAVLGLLLGFSPLVYGQTAALPIYACVQPGVQAQTSGLKSTNYLQGIVPYCTVTVYLTGTQTIATTTPQSPFVANANGSINPIYAAINQGYDVKLSGGFAPNNYSTPVTFTGLYPGTNISSPGACLPNIVSGGCTGVTSFTPYAPVVGGTTSTSPLQQPSAGTAGNPFLSGGSSALPGYGNLGIGGGGTGATTASGALANLGATGFLTSTGAPSYGCSAILNAGWFDTSASLNFYQCTNATGTWGWQLVGNPSGVTQIVAGTNITISPSGGTGIVTINSTGGGGGGGTGTTGQVPWFSATNTLTGDAGFTDNGSGAVGVNTLAVGTSGNPTAINVTCQNVSTLPTVGNSINDFREVCDGLVNTDCTTGGGSTHAWCWWTGSSWSTSTPTQNVFSGAAVSGELPNSTGAAAGSWTTVSTLGQQNSATNPGSLTIAGGSSTNGSLTLCPTGSSPTCAALTASTLLGRLLVGSATVCTVQAPTILTDGSPIAWTANGPCVSNAKVTLAHTTGTRALNISGLLAGAYFTIVISQDSTGGASLTGGTGCTWYMGGSTGYSASTTFNITTTVNNVNIAAAYYDGTNCYVNVR